MVNALDYGSSGPGSSPVQGPSVVFLGETLYSHSASLYKRELANVMLGITLRWTRKTDLVASYYSETGISSGLMDY